MLYLMRQPRPPLDAFVEAIWMVQADHGAPRDKVLPNGVTELIINLGARSHGVVDEHDETRNLRFHEAWVAGPQERHLVIDGVEETDLVGIRFKPGGAFPLLEVPMHEMTNQVREWSDLPPMDVDLLREELLETATRDARLDVLEHFLLRRLRWSPAVDPRLIYALTALQQVTPARSVREISADLDMSHRALISQFRREVGLTPKRVGRIYRLQSVVSRVAGHTSVSWAHVAQECGYADQAHMIREFRELADATPTEYLAHRYEGDASHMEIGS